MTGATDAAITAIDDARALLETLVVSGWREMHLASGGTEIFIGRSGAGTSPMRTAAAAEPAARAEPWPGPRTAVQAPHVGTIAEIAAAGASVTKGQTVARLRVLDTVEDVPSPVSGTVTGVDATAGDLVEYGMPILTIEETA